MTPGEGTSADGELGLADEAFAEAGALLERGFGKGAATRLYYALSHAIRAVPRVHGRYAKTHFGQLTLYRELIGDDPLLGELFELRGAGDYEPEKFTATTEELAELAERTAAFVAGARRTVDELLAAGPDEPDPPPDL